MPDLVFPQRRIKMSSNADSLCIVVLSYLRWIGVIKGDSFVRQIFDPDSLEDAVSFLTHLRVVDALSQLSSVLVSVSIFLVMLRSKDSR